MIITDLTRSHKKYAVKDSEKIFLREDTDTVAKLPSLSLTVSLMTTLREDKTKKGDYLLPTTFFYIDSR